jgi:hypothetical protein
MRITFEARLSRNVLSRALAPHRPARKSLGKAHIRGAFKRFDYTPSAIFAIFNEWLIGLLHFSASLLVVVVYDEFVNHGPPLDHVRLLSRK